MLLELTLSHFDWWKSIPFHKSRKDKMCVSYEQLPREIDMGVEQAKPVLDEWCWCHFPLPYTVHDRVDHDHAATGT